jgi:hypothetical protein
LEKKKGSVMLNNQTRVSDLTVEELVALIRELLREELSSKEAPTPRHQAKLLGLDPLHVGAWPEGLKLLSREEYYDDER